MDEARAVVPMADHSPVLPTRAVPLNLDGCTTVPLSHLCCYCLPWISNPPIHPREWRGVGAIFSANFTFFPFAEEVDEDMLVDESDFVSLR